MSDNINSIIAQPMGVDVLGQYQKWAALQQAQQDIALRQQQVTGANLGNQQAALILGVRQNMAAPLLGGGASPASTQGASLAGAGVSAPSAPQGGMLPPAQPGAGSTAVSDGSAPVAPAYLHSPGMPAQGQAIGQPVSTSGVQTMYGVPIPRGQALAVVMSQDPSAALKSAMELRRDRLQELLSQTDWQQGVTQAYQEGWMDPQHYQQYLQHPELRAAALQTLIDPGKYQDLLEKYSGHGMGLGPNGQQVSPVALTALGAEAQAKAGGTSAGELPLAGSLAAARAQGAATQETQDIKQPVLNPDGTPKIDPNTGLPQMTTVITNKADLAAAAHQGAAAQNPTQPSVLPGAMPSGTQPTMVIPGSALPPSVPGSTTMAGTLLGDVGAQPGAATAAPVTVPRGQAANVAATPLLPGTNPGWGQSPSNVPSPANRGLLPQAAPAVSVTPSAIPAPAATTPMGGVQTGAEVVTPAGIANIDTQKAAAQAQNAANITSLASAKTQAATAAQGAVQTNALLDQMRAEAPNFDHGSFTNGWQQVKKDWGSVAQALGQPNAIPPSVSSWEDFQKNWGALARTTARQYSSQGGVQELELVQKYLPSATMSSQAFTRIADQAQGINDYAIARNAALSQVNGPVNPAQFDAEFNKSITPTVFIVHRMPQGDMETLAANLTKTPEGTATWNRIKAGTQYAIDHGLFDAVGGQ